MPSKLAFHTLKTWTFLKSDFLIFCARDSNVDPCELQTHVPPLKLYWLTVTMATDLMCRLCSLEKKATHNPAEFKPREPKTPPPPLFVMSLSVEHLG